MDVDVHGGGAVFVLSALLLCVRSYHLTATAGAAYAVSVVLPHIVIIIITTKDQLPLLSIITLRLVSLSSLAATQ